jgi:hypothetical protein
MRWDRWDLQGVSALVANPEPERDRLDRECTARHTGHNQKIVTPSFTPLAHIGVPGTM